MSRTKRVDLFFSTTTKLLDKVTVLEKEKEDIDRWLNDDKEATVETKTDAENARAGPSCPIVCRRHRA